MNETNMATQTMSQQQAKARKWAILPYNSEKISGAYLISTFLGSWDILTPKLFKKLERLEVEEGDDLYNRLYEKGIIINDDNISGHVRSYQALNANMFRGASLHIAVMTTRCNIACTYCQTRVDNPGDIDKKVAKKILGYLFSMKNPLVHLEFQGGEAMLRWDIVKFMIQAVCKFNKAYHRKIQMSIISNGVLLKDDKMEFLVDHGVNICMSLDGPEDIHNVNRTFSSGKASYEFVADALTRLKTKLKEKNLKREINLLPTINRQNLPHLREIIDEYVKWGVASIALRPINKLGGAHKDWHDLGVIPEDFNRYWEDAMEYILELNKKGIKIKERMAHVMLTKIMAKQDPGYVDLMNPAGLGRAVLTYMPNGDIYPCDEARMMESDFFKLGNVFDHTYEDIINSPKFFALCQSSIMELYDYNSAYLPWMGTDPILNYRHQGNLLPKITQSPAYKINRFQFEFLFKKIIEDKDSLRIFENWVCSK